MGLWLEGWASDHAGKMQGRQSNRLLVAVTGEDTPLGLYLTAVGLLGVREWHDLDVTCLTPGTRDAIAVAVDEVGYSNVWSIEVAEVDWGTGKDPWEPGVHLFSIYLQGAGPTSATTMATAIIDAGLRRFDQSGEITPRMVRLMAAHFMFRKKEFPRK